MKDNYLTVMHDSMREWSRLVDDIIHRIFNRPNINANAGGALHSKELYEAGKSLMPTFTMAINDAMSSALTDTFNKQQ